MKRAYIRSLLFNLMFFGVSALFCVLYIPALLLPRKAYIFFVQIYHHVLVLLEYVFLGLRYEVRGKEHLPQDSSFLVAAKHMSAYETLKLRLLLNDPAIILKKELLMIPLWGTYLWKSGVIAIDRSTPEKALRSIDSGTLRMKERGRPIVIFPQGTRVHPEQTAKDRPYKPGIYRIQKATNLPIIPMATNSGLFWPKNGFFKSSGKVVFEFLPPIKPGMQKAELLSTLENTIETRSDQLMEEALGEQKSGVSLRITVSTLAVLCALIIYGFVWFKTADMAKEKYTQALKDIGTDSPVAPRVYGFPGPIRMSVDQETIKTPAGTITVHDLEAHKWALPILPLHIQTGKIEIESYKWNEPFVIDLTQADLKLKERTLHITDSLIERGETRVKILGTADLEQAPIPLLTLTLAIDNHEGLLSAMTQNRMLNANMAVFISAGLRSFADENGTVRVPIEQKNGALYAGPVPLVKLGRLRR